MAKSAFKNMSSKHTIGSLIFLILAVFIGAFLLNYFIGGGLFNTIEPFDNNTKLVYYYMEGCGHCNNFNSVWTDFTSQYEGNLTLEKLNQKDHESDIKKHNITGFPSVVLVSPNGDKIADFEEDRSVESLNDFINKHDTSS